MHIFKVEGHKYGKDRQPWQKQCLLTQKWGDIIKPI